MVCERLTSTDRLAIRQGRLAQTSHQPQVARPPTAGAQVRSAVGDLLRHDLLMAGTDNREWYRSSTWDSEIEANFEARLRRARPDGRAQYIGIQAVHLLDSPDPSVREMGRGLLRRVIEEYPMTSRRSQPRNRWATVSLERVDSMRRSGRCEKRCAYVRPVPSGTRERREPPSFTSLR